jgi:exo-beta-1,3-glucanase (GH17 family)/cellulose synthase/poly-beta-1,6-N-acetylglucosamine synthase-like glycosyltransferase
MKRVVSIVGRLFSSILIAVFIAGAQFMLWAWANRASEFTEADSNVRGYAYSGYQRHQSPLNKTYPSDEELDGDLKLLAQTSSRIRTYSSIDNADVVPLAAAHKMKVLAGCWLSADKEANERELAAAIEVANNNKNVDRLMIGNESLLREDLTVVELTDYLRRAQKLTKKPISTAEPWHVWLKHPELVKEVDFITVHLLPYHEGVPVEAAVKYAFQRYDELAKAFPKKKILIGEIGWPSKGPVIQAAVPSVSNEARFIREFLASSRTDKLDYYIMEAVDQPWKMELEGWAGAYWGIYNADRVAKFPLEGSVFKDEHWNDKAFNAALYALLPVFFIAFFLRDWTFTGRIWIGALVQACFTTMVVSLNVPIDYYLTQRDLYGLGVLIGATLITVAVLLSHGFEFGEILFKGRWKRRFTPLPPLPSEQEAFVSIHLACCNEPPEMVIATIDSLAAMDYSNFEVLVVDNNTKDEALWKPLEEYMAKMGPNFRFFHLAQWPGFKAGALNFALQQTDPRAQVVGVVDADYVVTPDWLSTLVPHFGAAPSVAVVQAPQAHREWETQPFRRMCNWEFDGFFRIGMHHRNERNALIQHGTMTLVRAQALKEVGGWSEWCICEDTELGLRLIKKGYETRYIDHILGRGLTPSDFSAIKSQRFRWAFGAMQILKGHIVSLLSFSKLTLAQRYHFLTGWFSWFGDALQLVFTFASLAWTIAMLELPKSFGLPVTTMIYPILGFMVFKAALGPILYRRTMDCPWKDILGASILSVGISHAIARGIFAGIVKRKGEFVRTPKGWKEKGRLAFFAPIREELGLMIALYSAAAATLSVHGTNDMATVAWAGILVLESIPYVGALLCQIASYMPDKGGAEEKALAIAA